MGKQGLSREQCEELEEISKDRALKKFADNNFWKSYFNKDPKPDSRILGNIVKSWRLKQAANLQEKHEDSKSKHDDQLSSDLPANSSVQQSCSQTGDSRPKVGQGQSVRVSVSVIIYCNIQVTLLAAYWEQWAEQRCQTSSDFGQCEAAVLRFAPNTCSKFNKLSFDHRIVHIDDRSALYECSH